MARISTSMAGIGSAVIALAIHATWTVTSAADPSMDRFGNWVVGSPSPGMCSMTSIPGKDDLQITFLSNNGTAGVLLSGVQHIAGRPGSETLSVDGSVIHESHTIGSLKGPLSVLRQPTVIYVALAGGEVLHAVYTDDGAGAARTEFDVSLLLADGAVRALRTCIKREAL